MMNGGIRYILNKKKKKNTYPSFKAVNVGSDPNLNCYLDLGFPSLLRRMLSVEVEVFFFCIFSLAHTSCQIGLFSLTHAHTDLTEDKTSLKPVTEAA